MSVLSFKKNMSTLAKLHVVLLLKLGVMKTLSIVMKSMPAHLEGLNLQSIEVEVIA